MKASHRASARLPLILALPLVVAGVMPGLPSAEASHAMAFPHVNPRDVRLAPGASETVDLSFNEPLEVPPGTPEGGFGADWVFIINARRGDASGPVEVALRRGHMDSPGATVVSWTVRSAGTEVLTARLPASDLYSLVFRNPSVERNASLVFVYDQACNCASKPIPVEVPGLTVIFNADARQGATWKATFPEPPVHALKVTLAKRTDNRSRWPEDFQVLLESPQGVRNAPRPPMHELTWTADETTRYYFFVQSTRQDLSKFDRSDPAASVMVSPSFEQLSATESRPVPEAPLLGLVAVTAAGFLLRRR